jgi:hypothetical protein
VHILSGALQIDLQRRKSPAPDIQGRLIFFPLPAVRTEHHIAGQQFALGGDKIRHLGTADLFLAFKKEFDVYRQSARGFQHGLDCQNRNEHVAFII